jgi:hypothetical protein
VPDRVNGAVIHYVGKPNPWVMGNALPSAENRSIFAICAHESLSIRLFLFEMMFSSPIFECTTH